MVDCGISEPSFILAFECNPEKAWFYQYALDGEGKLPRPNGANNIRYNYGSTGGNTSDAIIVNGSELTFKSTGNGRQYFVVVYKNS